MIFLLLRTYPLVVVGLNSTALAFKGVGVVDDGRGVVGFVAAPGLPGTGGLALMNA